MYLETRWSPIPTVDSYKKIAYVTTMPTIEDKASEEKGLKTLAPKY